MRGPGTSIRQIMAWVAIAALNLVAIVPVWRGPGSVSEQFGQSAFRAGLVFGIAYGGRIKNHPWRIASLETCVSTPVLAISAGVGNGSSEAREMAQGLGKGMEGTSTNVRAWPSVAADPARGSASGSARPARRGPVR